MPITDRFARVKLADIRINRERRQRREIDTKGLKESVAKHGVLVPIVLDQDMLLVFGERRYTASSELGLPDIPVRFVEDMTPIELQILELEENLKREDLVWQDQTRAIGTIHQLYCALDQGWTISETASNIGLSQGQVSIYLKVHDFMDEDRIVRAGTVREAYNLLSRRDQRAQGEALQELLDDDEEEALPLLEVALPSGGGVIPAGAGPASPGATVSAVPAMPKSTSRAWPAAEDSILRESFLHWAGKYSGKKFNLIHCDFPYGINLFAGPQAGGARGAMDRPYEDSKDVYFALLETLCNNLDRLMSVSAHLLFWYSAKHHDATMATFHKLAPSLEFLPHPLIWVKSDGAGIAPDSRRTPRHVYETCLMASRGGRNIVKIVADAYSAPTDNRLHNSTKPEPMLKHFMGMLVDENTRMLDPTCGSAAALRAAEELGASAVLGMDIDEQVVGIARVALRNSRSLRTASRGGS